MDSTWTVKSLLDWSHQYFTSKQLPTPRLDAEVLLAHALGCKRIELYLNFDKPTGPQERERFKDLVRRRAAREPLAYLTGETGFWAFTLKVGPGCLIPRPETEILVEEALAVLKKTREALGSAVRLRVVELGSGSGAVPLALAHEMEDLDILSLDRSAQALFIAAGNRERFLEVLAQRRNRLWLARGDRLESVASAFQPHLVVSNPPYIPSSVIPGLEPEVSVHEPALALDGGQDGLAFYRYLADWSARHLAPQGGLAVEIGADQAQEVAGIFSAHPELKVLGVRQDLAKRDRVVTTIRV
ncbi:MAG: peptide chain release factor N(5)-glutamine methyltransferase [Deltaproteobacteria bacterium]|nr:peptide chain release factor N(5)-glutamine methyltransferase [Deltaproteobacteria bacterium]